jgi:molybdopterin converting factor subunit 1
MTLTVLLFARLRDVAGTDRVSVVLPAASTVADVRHRLAAAHPDLAGLLDRSAVAVNHDFADDARVLTPGDEVAVIPPVSGGSSC